MRPPFSTGRKITFLLCATLFFLGASGQMRQLHLDTISTENYIVKLSFYSGSTGYVAATANSNDWVGFTSDSGRSFTKKFITLSNVDFNGYSVNLTFGFTISGVKAFQRDTLIAYGHYGLVPAILHSADGGNSFKLVYHSQFAFVPNSYISDMVFPENGNIGYAVDVDRILKTTDRGLTWTVTRTDPSSYFDYLEATDNNNLISFSTYHNSKKLLKTTNGGTSWQQLTIPAGTINYAHFISSDKGWLNMQDDDEKWGVYYTSNGGTSWTLKNNFKANPFLCIKLHFTNDSTGYAMGGLYTLAKTSDSGRTWEYLPRDNSFTYLGFSHRDMQFHSQDQFWAGGARDFIEISTNAGGTRIPKAYFTIDTTNVYLTGIVRLNNYSRKIYQYKWFVNGSLVSTGYNATYNHILSRNADTIKLVVSNGVLSDTVEKIQYFVVPPLPDITSFTPATGSNGTLVTITGTGFADALGVQFGGVPAAGFTIVSDTKITAVVAAGATGYVRVNNFYGADSLPGFTYFPPPVSPAPVITAMVPEAGPVGTVVTLTGNNFNTTPVVYFGDTKAQVTAASANSITCIVPAGASYKPVSVLNTATHLSGNTKPFGVTFPDGGNFTYNSFKQKLVVEYEPYTSPYHGMADDIDNDGKTDLISNLRLAGGVDSLLVHRNTSSGSDISFQAPRAIGGYVHALGTGKFTAGDLDGDGKKDILVTTNGSPDAWIFRNTSTPGNISFEPKVEVVCGGGSQDAVIDDLDNDGRPDLAVATFNHATVSVVRNTSSPGYLSFAGFISLNTTGGTVDVAVGDLDGDGKKEIISFDNGSSTINISVFRNTSSTGNISFATGVSFPVDGETHNGRDIFAADYDGDNKTDVILQTDEFFIVFRNTSATGNISFAPQVKYATNGTGQGSTVANLSGDARPDFIGGLWSGNFRLYRNTSTPGVINTEERVQYEHGSWSTGAADFNGDGKTDIILVQNGTQTDQITILENTMGKMLDASGCAKDMSITADLPGATFQWQRDAGSGFVNITNDAVFSGAQTNKLTLTNAPASWTGQKFRCQSDSRFSSVFSITVQEPYNPSVTMTASDTVMCFNQGITFTATGINGGPGAEYIWYRNGERVGDNSPTYTLSGIYTPDQTKINVLYRTHSGCWVRILDESDTITVTVRGGPTSVSMDVSPIRVCEGNTATFTARPLSPGTAPAYQWQVNGVNAGTNSPTFILTPSNNDKVRVIMVSNEVCGPHEPDTSSIYTMSVIPYLTPSVTISMNTPAPICQGNAVSFSGVLQDVNTGGSWQWQVNGVNAGTNSTQFTAPSLNNNDQVRVVLNSFYLCETKDTVHSNIITVPVNPVVAPSITLAGNTTVTQGSATMLTTTVTNEGTGPSYTWQDSTSAHTWADIPGAANMSLNYTPAATGVKVRARMTSNAVCANPALTTSNVLTFTVNAVTGVNPVPANSMGIRYYPNPVQSYLFVDSLNLADKWQTMIITDITGKRPVMSVDVRNKTSVWLYLRQLASGQYIAILQRRQGTPVYLKFVKL